MHPVVELVLGIGAARCVDVCVKTLKLSGLGHRVLGIRSKLSGLKLGDFSLKD